MAYYGKNLDMDDFALASSDAKEFENGMNLVSKATVWREIPAASCTVYGFLPGEYEAANAALIKKTAKEFILSTMDERLARDTLNGARLFIDLGDGSHPLFLRDTAIPSLFGRAGLECSTKLRRELVRYNPDAMAAILNVGLSMASGSKPMKVCMCAGKVNAMLSPSYNILGNQKVIEAAKDILAEKFGELEFHYGEITHGKVCAFYTMPEATNDFVAKYEKAIENTTCYSQVVNSVVPAVRIVSSDCGQCSATIVPKILINGKPRSFLKPMKTRHIGEQSENLEAWENSCRMVYAKLDETVEMIDKMAHTDIFYPMNTIQNLCKKIKLPEKWLLAAKELHSRFGDGICSMLDVYYSIYGAIDLAGDKKFGNLEEKVARLLLLDWSDYDTSVVID